MYVFSLASLGLYTNGWRVVKNVLPVVNGSNVSVTLEVSFPRRNIVVNIDEADNISVKDEKAGTVHMGALLSTAKKMFDFLHTPRAHVCYSNLDWGHCYQRIQTSNYGIHISVPFFDADGASMHVGDLFNLKNPHNNKFNYLPNMFGYESSLIITTMSASIIKWYDKTTFYPQYISGLDTFVEKMLGRDVAVSASYLPINLMTNQYHTKIFLTPEGRKNTSLDNFAKIVGVQPDKLTLSWLSEFEEFILHQDDKEFDDDASEYREKIIESYLNKLSEMCNVLPQKIIDRMMVDFAIHDKISWKFLENLVSEEVIHNNRGRIYSERYGI